MTSRRLFGSHTSALTAVLTPRLNFTAETSVIRIGVLGASAPRPVATLRRPYHEQEVYIVAVELFDMLETDHDEIKNILDDLSETSDQAEKTRESGFMKLKAELIPHMRGEEQALYPVLQSNEETREMALEAIEEHRAAEKVLNELDGMPVNAEAWLAKITVLQEMLEHHIDEEESKIFPKAEKEFDNSRFDQILTEIQEIKQDMKMSIR